MSYSSQVSLLICTLMTLLVALALPFVTSDLRPAQRTKLPWRLIAVALVALVFAVKLVRHASPTQNQILTAIAVTTVMVVGICAKWAMEIAADKPLGLHERNLMGALLVAPIVVALVGDGVFAANLAPRTLVLWFANGFFWHAVITDIVRMRTPERVIVRRIEP
jgi:hypothetical protein